MKKLIAVLVLAAASMSAETVHFSPNGKTFHTNTKCMALSRSKTVLHADREAALKHDLRECKICLRTKSNKQSKTDRNAWAK